MTLQRLLRIAMCCCIFVLVCEPYTIAKMFIIAESLPLTLEDHVFGIGIFETYDYNKPTSSDSLNYVFYLAIETDRMVDLVEFLTPAGNNFRIPKQEKIDADGIETWHYIEEGTHCWEYQAKFNEMDGLQDYGNGTYTITVYYGGGKTQTSVWLGIPHTNDPIPQPTQEPILTFPAHKGTTLSPVTFTWEPCNDANATSIWLHLEKEGTDEETDINLRVDDTNSGPIVFSEGIWHAELCFDHWYDFNNVDGIPVEIGKYSKSNYTFEIISQPSIAVDDTRLLLHLNGSDGTTSTTDSSPSGHTPISFEGTAQLDTAEKKWGSASLLLDGDGDYLTIADSPDWDIYTNATDDWTIDFWVRHDSHSAYEVYLHHYQVGYKQWCISHEPGYGLAFYSVGGGPTLTAAGEISDNKWHHIALCKVADEYGMYKDGQQINYTQTSDVGTIDGPLYIGGYAGGSFCFDGHMDEVRITHSNIFGASPNPGKIDTITVPIGEYGVPEPNTPPDAPSNLTVMVVSSSQINLNWDDNSDNEDGFKIERKIGAFGSWAHIDTVSADETSYEDTGLLAETTYYYRILACNIVGDSAYSNEDSAITTQPSVDDTRLLLHLNGSDGTTSTTDSSPSGHTPISFEGTAQLDTAEKKWGSASLLLDGDGDYLTIADSPDWDIYTNATDDWTIDFWVRHDSHSAYEVYLHHYQVGYKQWCISHEPGSGLAFYSVGGGPTLTAAGEISDSKWHHIALCKVADEYGIYKDGQQINYTQTSNVGTIDGPLYIGGYAGGSFCFDGHMDEVRITHSNIFGASPNPGKIDTITVPTGEY